MIRKFGANHPDPEFADKLLKFGRVFRNVRINNNLLGVIGIKYFGLMIFYLVFEIGIS